MTKSHELPEEERLKLARQYDQAADNLMKQVENNH